MEKIVVGVIFGGRTVEHEVSIISALQAIQAMDKNKYQPLPLYISKDGQWYGGEALLDIKAYKNLPELLKQAQPLHYDASFGAPRVFAAARGMFGKGYEQRIDIALPVVHGTTVEDGCLQGLLELSGVPYVGPDVLGSAVGMDKTMMKAVLKEAGLPVVDYYAFCDHQWQDDAEAICAAAEARLGYPLIVKPANLGSSIGISRAEDREQMRAGVEAALMFTPRILLERAVAPLREINIAVLGFGRDLQLSCCEEPLAQRHILSFADKYLAASQKGMSGAKRRIPAELSDEQRQRIEDIARRSFTAMNCSGVCRIDFLLDEDSGEIYVNELNTIPGSLSFYLFEPLGLGFSELIEKLLQTALARQRQRDKLVSVYESNILAAGNFKGKK
ncbi:MAG: D-alanine--D-alanine ligase family protein [Bacillota bacterium]|nr:D-alanine--D-alanine ligase family protein [Bacillota bacterium]